MPCVIPSMEDANADVRLCALLDRDCFFWIAFHLNPVETTLLRTLCSACAEFCGDAALSTSQIVREGWAKDFFAFRTSIASAPQSSRFQGSVESQYCRRRCQMRRLAYEAPEVLRTWQIGNQKKHVLPKVLMPSGLCFRRDAGTREGQGIGSHRDGSAGSASDTRPPQPAVDARTKKILTELQTASHKEKVHGSGELMEILQSGLVPWRCGPFALFDRVRWISANTYHDVTLVLEVRTSAETGENPSSVYRFRASLSDWSERHLDSVNSYFCGKELLLPPNGDFFAVDPLPSQPDCLQPGVVLVSRGQNAFLAKMQNVATGGFAGAVVCNHQEGPLFRMFSGASSKVDADLPPALLVSQVVGATIQDLLARGRTLVRAVEACRLPKSFQCIGSDDVKENGTEIWVVSDATVASLGYVLVVPPSEPPKVVAHSLFDFLCDVVRLDKQNTELLNRRAPSAFEMLQAEADSAPSVLLFADVARLNNLRESIRHMHGNHPLDVLDLVSLMAGVHRAHEERSDTSPRGNKSTNKHTGAGAWDKDRQCYHFRLPRRIKRSHISVDVGVDGTELFSVLKPVNDMSLEAVLEASGCLGDDVEVFISAQTADVLCANCILIEQQLLMPPGRESTGSACRRGFQGATAIFDRVRRIAPADVNECWKSFPDESSDVVSCEVSVRCSQLCGKWSDPSGYKGNFLEPLWNLFELFVEVPRTLRFSRTLKPGDVILVKGSTLCSSSECLNLGRQKFAPKHDNGKLQANPAALDVEVEMEADEDLVPFRMLHDTQSELSFLDADDNDLQVSPQAWCVYLPSNEDEHHEPRSSGNN